MAFFSYFVIFWIENPVLNVCNNVLVKETEFRDIPMLC